MLSIVIPTLNAGGYLAATLEPLLAEARGDLPFEVIVVDSGSVDDTAFVTERGGAIFIEAPRGRGTQLAAGANEAGGEWLLFLHGDTRLAAGWTQAVQRFIAEPANERRAGYFRFALDDKARAARFLEMVVGLRGRLFGLPYGDQGLLISRDFYETIGGYKRMPLMEDVDIVRRIGRARLLPLDATAVTSADKYRRDGYLWRPLRNLMLLTLYTVGVSARTLQSLYR